jgi:hypothetical protein
VTELTLLAPNPAALLASRAPLPRSSLVRAQRTDVSEAVMESELLCKDNYLPISLF